MMMADFEPLQSDDDEEVLGEFGVQEKRKKDLISGKKHKAKSGQLFTRKSIDKKDKTLVIEHSKAIASSSGPAKSSHHRHIEGLVGPGDVEFSSSPPIPNESAMAHYLSQSTGSIPQQIQHANRPQQQGNNRFPVSPQQWTVSKQQTLPSNVSNLQQSGRQVQHTQSQEKLTLLERAKLMAEYQKTKGTSNVVGSPGSLPSLSVSPHETVFYTDGSDRPCGTSTFVAQHTLPRVGSPLERAASAHPPSISPPPPIHNGTNGTDLWQQSSQNSESQDGAENWARFESSSGSFTEMSEEGKKRRPSQVSTISEGSESSSEIDDSVWKITEEQRLYYLNQFKKLQPNEKAVIKGPQARDFFLKSNLPVEILSKIWHLSDINKDNALNLEEFCIAMHLVVAVRHDIELPPVLPPTLHPKEEVDPFDVPFTDVTANQQPQVVVESTNETVPTGVSNDEKPQSPQPRPQSWARFESQSRESSRAGSSSEAPQYDEQGATCEGPTPRTASTPAGGKVPLESAAILQSQHQVDPSNVPSQRHMSTDSITDHHTSRQAAADTATQPKRDSEENLPSATTTTTTAGSSTKKLSSQIARPRASGGMVNLLDTKPGQLLPPPETKKSRKKLIMPKGASESPPTSPPRQLSPVQSPTDASDFKPFPAPNDGHVTTCGSTTTADVVGSATERGEEKAEGYQAPQPTPRLSTEEVSKNARIEQAELPFRRTPSMRKGDRPRSYTGGSMSSLESFESPSVADVKDSRLPPTPPPRKQKGHKRGSSLDLNKLFGNKAQKGDDLNATSVQPLRQDNLPPTRALPTKQEVKDDKMEQKDSTEFLSIARPRPSPITPSTGHRISGSNEWASGIAPPPKPTNEGVIRDSPSTIYPKRPSVTKPTRSKSLDPSQLLNDEKYRLPNVVNRSSKKQMRRNEVQAGIRLLREKNGTISSLNSELQHELKELTENRTSLELKLNKLKQSLE